MFLDGKATDESREMDGKSAQTIRFKKTQNKVTKLIYISFRFHSI
jgi:hypothetical protein